jgi:hypothetical protein
MKSLALLFAMAQAALYKKITQYNISSGGGNFYHRSGKDKKRFKRNQRKGL